MGSSLGINLLPTQGKLCNFDCVYCECGWNKDGRVENVVLPTAQDVREALEEKLKDCAGKGVPIDSITFSGNGEPTLNPDFPAIVDAVVFLRGKYYPEAKVSVLSNATMLNKDGVFVSLGKIDNPILKIDAGSDALISLINRPQGEYKLAQVVERMRQLDGNFVLQTMFFGGENIETADPANLEAWKKIVRYVRPREVMVYTIDRETPDKTLRKYTVQQMETLTRDLADEGFNIHITG